MDLGMTEAAKQMNVSEDCLCYWENGRNEPCLFQYPAIIAYLGYYPFEHETESFGGKIKRYKCENGLSNEKLAKMLEVDEGTIPNWEKVKLCRSSGISNMFFRLSQKMPLTKRYFLELNKDWM